MGFPQPKPVYGYSVKNASVTFEADSITAAIKDLFGEWNQNLSRGAYESLKSDHTNKRSCKGYIFFYKIDGENKIQPHQIHLAMNNNKWILNYKNRIDWAKLERAHQAHRTPVICWDDHGNEFYFNSITEAAENVYGNKSNIVRALRNYHKGDPSHGGSKPRLKSYGYYWRYA